MGKLGNVAVWLRGRRGVVLLVLLGWVALVVTGAGPESDSAGSFTVSFLPMLILGVVVALAITGLVLLPFLFKAQEGPLWEASKDMNSCYGRMFA
jgi:hypothetical protein